MWLFVLACLLPPLVISALVTAAVRRLAPRWGLVDRPAARKVHTTPTPLGGGIGIWAGVVLSVGLAQLAALWLTRGHAAPAWLTDALPDVLRPHVGGVLYRAGELWAILGCTTVLAGMGLVDDWRNLPWWPRLLGQFAVAAVLVFGVGVQATVFVPVPIIGQLLTLLWILVLVNALNFLDNMDALCGGIGLIAAGLFAVVMLTGTSEPRWLVGGALLVLAGSIAGFLFFHNWPPARIFMGDCGSYFIGTLLATLTVLGTYFEHDADTSRHTILAPLCILAVPLYDFTSVMLIRLAQGRSPFQPDRSHFSHRLVERGLSKTGAVLTVHLTTLTTGLGGLLLYQVPGWTGAGIVLGLVGCVLAVIAVLETAGRRGLRVVRQAPPK